MLYHKYATVTILLWPIRCLPFCWRTKSTYFLNTQSILLLKSSHSFPGSTIHTSPAMAIWNEIVQLFHGNSFNWQEQCSINSKLGFDFFLKLKLEGRSRNCVGCHPTSCPQLLKASADGTTWSLGTANPIKVVNQTRIFGFCPPYLHSRSRGTL